MHNLRAGHRKIVEQYYSGVTMVVMPGDQLHSELMHIVRAVLRTMAERY